MASAWAPLLAVACGSGDPGATTAVGPAPSSGPASSPSETPAAPPAPPSPPATSPTPPPAPRDAGPLADADASSNGWSCRAKGSEVVMIGDSYLALSGDVTKQLLRYAHGTGALADGDAYRTYYVSGTQMSGGVIGPNIPTQFDDAVKADPDIRYVIMDGGGNDILVGNSACITTSPPPANASCAKTVDDAIAGATALLAKMQAAGVQKVVYFFYPHLPTAGKPYVNQTLDYAFPLVKAVCDNAPIPCFFVDTRPAFEGHPEFIGPDGIHPTTAGADVIALLVWETMAQACIAQ